MLNVRSGGTTPKLVVTMCMYWRGKKKIRQRNDNPRSPLPDPTEFLKENLEVIFLQLISLPIRQKCYCIFCLNFWFFLFFVYFFFRNNIWEKSGRELERRRGKEKEGHTWRDVSFFFFCYMSIQVFCFQEREETQRYPTKYMFTKYVKHAKNWQQPYNKTSKMRGKTGLFSVYFPFPISQNQKK